MENITHSLIGVVLGETASRLASRREKPISPATRTALLTAAVAGSNFPDLDVLLRPILQGGTLGMLLHHRGHSHTLALSVPLALVAAGLGRLVARGGWQKRAWPWLVAAAWLGVLGHLTADFWNDYGVHPFWPFDDHWYYGDTIFIFEPLLWLGLLPFVFSNARSRWARPVCLLLGGALLVAAWSGKYVSWPIAAFMTAWCLVWSAACSKWRSVALPYGAIALVLAIFASARAEVRGRLLAGVPSDEKILQLATTPSPSNPLCWKVVLTTRKEKATGSPPFDYVGRVGIFVLHPFGLGENGDFAPNDPALCMRRLMSSTAPNDALWASVDAPSLALPGVTWSGEFRGLTGQLAAGAVGNCRLGAAMRYIRSPFWLMGPYGDAIIGDLRYHSGRGLGFADVSTRRREACYPYEPPWVPPSKTDLPFPNL